LSKLPCGFKPKGGEGENGGISVEGELEWGWVKINSEGQIAFFSFSGKNFHIPERGEEVVN